MSYVIHYTVDTLNINNNNPKCPNTYRAHEFDSIIIKLEYSGSHRREKALSRRLKISFYAPHTKTQRVLHCKLKLRLPFFCILYLNLRAKCQCACNLSRLAHICAH